MKKLDDFIFKHGMKTKIITKNKEVFAQISIKPWAMAFLYTLAFLNALKSVKISL